MFSPTITIQLAQSNQKCRAWVFENILLDVTILIVLDVVAQNPDAVEWSEALGASLATQIVGLGGKPVGSFSESESPLDPVGFSTAHGARVAMGLIIDLGNGVQQESASRYSVLSLGEKVSSILPILRWPDRSIELQELLPKRISELNADFLENWQADPDPVADHLLALAGVTTPDRRVFLSDRRDETEGFAKHLHGALVKANFDVFLDTVDVPPAAPFQAVLLEELGNKAMVVLIDSPRYSKSEWCQEELRFAEKPELGLLVLRTPAYTEKSNTVVDYAARIEPVIPAAVIELSLDQLADHSAAVASRRLSEMEALTQCILEIELEHQRACTHRKRQLQSNVVASFHAEGMETEITEGGLIQAKASGSRAEVLIISSSPRRSELHEFQGCHLASKTGSTLVAFLAALRSHRRSPYDWVGQLANIRIYNIVEIPEMTRHLKARVQP